MIKPGLFSSGLGVSSPNPTCPIASWYVGSLPSGWRRREFKSEGLCGDVCEREWIGGGKGRRGSEGGRRLLVEREGEEARM